MKTYGYLLGWHALSATRAEPAGYARRCYVRGSFAGIDGVPCPLVDSDGVEVGTVDLLEERERCLWFEGTVGADHAEQFVKLYRAGWRHLVPRLRGETFEWRVKPSERVQGIASVTRVRGIDKIEVVKLASADFSNLIAAEGHSQGREAIEAGAARVGVILR